VVISYVSRDSGSRWKSAPPNMPPADRLTIFNSLFLVSFSLNVITNTPTRETRLIDKTLRKVYTPVIYMLNPRIK
jgi:hypothetical protein